MRSNESPTWAWTTSSKSTLRLLDGAGQRLNVLASTLGVGTKVLTKTVEPFLLRSGLIVKSDAGLRQLTELGREHLANLATETVPKQA